MKMWQCPGVCPAEGTQQCHTRNWSLLKAPGKTCFLHLRKTNAQHEANSFRNTDAGLHPGDYGEKIKSCIDVEDLEIKEIEGLGLVCGIFFSFWSTLSIRAD